MKRLIRSLLSTTTVAAASFMPLLHDKGMAQSMPICENLSTLNDAQFAQNVPPNGYRNGCSATPERYAITIYEMGFCTSNPLSGGLDRSTCSTTFESSGGQTVDLAGSASITLDETNATRPPSDTYNYGFMVMSNTFGLRGSVTTSTSTWVSDGADFDGINSNTTNAVGAVAANFDDTLTNFNPGGACTSSASATMSLGTMSAILANNSLSEATTCAGVTRLVGAFAPTTAYEITDDTTALKITFNVTNKGMSVLPMPAPLNTGARQMASGPFEMEITVVE